MDHGIVSLRCLTEQDLGLLHDWFNRPHLVEWWGGELSSPEAVRQQYHPGVLSASKVTSYIGLLDGRPFAYAQSYVALGSGDGWWQEETDPGVRGIDQAIGDEALLGKGYGSLLVRALVDLLFANPEVSKVQVDPSPRNLRAIRCFEKAGFRQVGLVSTPDGPAMYMVCDRPSSSRRPGPAWPGPAWPEPGSA